MANDYPADGSEIISVRNFGRYNVTPPTLTDTQRGDAQLDARGNLRATLGTPALNTGLDATGLAPVALHAQASGLFNPLRVAAGVADADGGQFLFATSVQWFNGTSWDRARTPFVFKPFASTGIVAGTGATVWTPAAGKKFRLMGWLISSSVAGQLIFGDNLVATILARSEAVAAAGVSKAGFGDLGNGILSAAANNVLKLDGPTGNVAGMVWGTEE